MVKKWRQKVLAASIGLLAIYLLLCLYVATQVYVDTRSQSDVIIVLGAKSYRDKQFNPCLKARVEQAVGLYQQGFAPKLLMSGGNDSEDYHNEAETMREIALNLGANDQDIIMEKYSSSTYENLLFSQRIMQRNKMQTALIVSEPFHLPRAGFVAKRLGLDYSLSPALDSPCWTRWKYLSRYFLKEPLAIIYYVLRGRI